MRFWLVLLTEHDVLHLLNVLVAMHRTRSAAVWLRDNRTRLAGSLQQTIDASKFLFSNSCREIHSTAFTHHTPLTDRDF